MQWIKIERALFTLFVFAVLAGALQLARGWSIRAAIVILLLGSIGLFLCLAQLAKDSRDLFQRSELEALTMEAPAAKNESRWGAWEIWSWIIGFYAAVNFVGFLAAVPLLVFLYAKLYGGGWQLSVVMAACSWGFIYAVFDMLLHVPWPKPLIYSLLS